MDTTRRTRDRGQRHGNKQQPKHHQVRLENLFFVVAMVMLKQDRVYCPDDFTLEATCMGFCHF